LSHNASIFQGWTSRLFLERVSDDDYFQDFGSSLDQTSRQFVRSSASLSGVGRYWTFEMLFDDFQVIDESVKPGNEPYRRLPRMGFSIDRPLGTPGLGISLDSELVYFDRDFGVTGARFDVISHIYWERFTGWGFIRPSLGYRYTSYRLDQLADPVNTSESPDRGTTIASLDAGLFFEKTLANGGYQTLEPRLFYLYVPFEDQKGLPNFDTGEFTFGFSQLFNTNRFAGSDRQSDANQLSLAVTTRSMSETGMESWSFSVGQIMYFEDRQVQLKPSQDVDDSKVSPLIAEFVWHPFQRISARAGLQWNWDDNNLDVGSVGMSYSGKGGQRVIFDYRFRRDRVDQFDFRFFWPINERWRVLSRLNYSFADDDLLEAQAGFEYESCCWAIRTVFRRYLKNRDGDYRDGIYFELNLKGLASARTGPQGLFAN
jgi:LPS-assembly protein